VYNGMRYKIIKEKIGKSGCGRDEYKREENN
jgi:hypothetical protein